MYDSVVFYNNWHLGDIFTSREFAKYLSCVIPAKSFSYAHNNAEYLISDLFEYTPVNKFCIDNKGFHIVDNVLYINTWIGRDKRFVGKDTACTLENMKKMYNEILAGLQLPSIQRGVDTFLPEVDYSILDRGYTDRIDNLPDGKYVLISNGQVFSSQSHNTDYTPVIARMCRNFKDITFITTEDTGLHFENLLNTSSIIGKSGCDILEISYLSERCNVIIGRAAGPYVYSQTKKNYNDSNKTFVGFSISRDNGHLASFETPAKKVWDWDINYDLIERAING